MRMIEATTPCTMPPAWAFLERALIDTMNQAVYPFLEKYTREDGTLIWRDELPGRDGADDFYESFFNWPLLYLLGGGSHLLELAEREWDAVTKQLTQLGLVYKEYERGYDQFHQSESYIYFYYLCMADPTNPLLQERARRFAGLYLNEDPDAPNYDAERKLIRAPHNGSGGPRWGFSDSDRPSYGWSATMERYGLPYTDVPGITSYEDLKDPALARRMGEVMQARMGRGDVATNLGVTSLIANAYLITGDEKYRRWLLDYTDTWWERGKQNDGLLPDNAGLSGQVGEYMDGKWYGGLYGWTWPHGFYNIEMAAIVAAQNAYLLSGDKRYLELPRKQMERILELGIVQKMDDTAMSLREHWIAQVAPGDEEEILLVPYRYGDTGWFDYQPLSPVFPIALWNMSYDQADRAVIERIRNQGGSDWRQVIPFRNKEECGHEPPWICFLASENPGYPEAILSASYGTVCRRLEQIRQDGADLTKVNIHHWQQLNPVVTEALVQLTLGAPQPIYNGGLLHCQVRYYDAVNQRPGLPEDVGALVEQVEAGSVHLRLVNLNPYQERALIIQAGAFGEHQIVSVRYPVRTSDYPGKIGSYAPPEPEQKIESLPVDDCYLRVHLPPAHEIQLELELSRFTNRPSYALPWERDSET